MLSLVSPISELPRVGPTTVKYLKKLGLDTVYDLLFYFPFRYDDYSQQQAIADIKIGDTVNIRGTIEMIQNRRSPRQRKALTEALISDKTETIKVIWFNQPFIARNIKVGDEVSLAGKVADSYGQATLISPQYEKVTAQEFIHTQNLVPNYHLTDGLGQKQLRSFIRAALSSSDQLADWLPTEIKKNLQLLDLSTAVRLIHFPKKAEEVQTARARLSFGELFLRSLKSQFLRRELKTKNAPIIPFQEEATKKLVSSLPFKLTEGQRKAAWEIIGDLGKAEPMSRLLEGDVGSGKTLVAAIALLNTAVSGQQATLMAPTEILAHQHYKYLSKLLGDFNIKIGLITNSYKEANYELETTNRKINKKDKQKAISLEILEQADIIIGTHAIIQDNIHIPRLALAIVDEQHRFGVSQRKTLLKTGVANITPHFLSLSATPIPRSLSLALYGDLDLSIISELPQGRRPISTKLLKETERLATYDFIKQEIKAGRQAFIICPLVEESDKSGFKSVKEETERLKREVFSEYNLAALHGRLKGEEKEKIMSDFLNKKTDILVSTAVVEVGVDIQNASVMLIEGADHFGLSQLHQFRGRVGRGDQPSYCFLLPSKEEISNSKTIERLESLVKYHDGFALAKIDLRLRGAGEVYGQVQSGFPELRIASLFDYELIKQAQTAAEELINRDYQLTNYPLLKQQLGEFERSAHLE